MCVCVCVCVRVCVCVWAVTGWLARVLRLLHAEIDMHFDRLTQTKVLTLGARRSLLTVGFQKYVLRSTPMQELHHDHSLPVPCTMYHVPHCIKRPPDFEAVMHCDL